MKVQVNTDHHIKGHEALATGVRATVETALNRFRDHITRVEVHLSDENGNKGGPNDKRCSWKPASKAASPRLSHTRQRP